MHRVARLLRTTRAASVSSTISRHSHSAIPRRLASTLNTISIATVAATRPNPTPVGTHESLIVPADQLKSGYSLLHKRMGETLKNMQIAAVSSPLVAGAWLLATQQALLASPVAMSVLLAGSAYILNRSIHLMRAKKYAYLSTITSSDGPALSPAINEKIKQVIAGEDPRIKISASGITVSGPLGDLKNPSHVVEETVSKIKNMNRIVVPDIFLHNNFAERVALVHQRWCSRFIVPFNILNIFAFLGKNSEETTADDYAVLAASIYNTWDYFNGPSVKEAREKVTNALTHSKTPQAVLETIIHPSTLNYGAMSFLTIWNKNYPSVGVRVGRTGAVVLHRGDRHTFFGPYPARPFPEPEVTLAAGNVSSLPKPRS